MGREMIRKLRGHVAHPKNMNVFAGCCAGCRLTLRFSHETSGVWCRVC